jgi:hypothetical protein
MSGAWRLDPFARVVRFVGDFPEPSDNELAEYGYLTHGQRSVKPINHGTEGGYLTHRRRGQKPCDSCQRASNLAASARHARRKARRAEAA